VLEVVPRCGLFTLKNAFVQVTTNFGACRPAYLAYTQFVSILCDYLMDVLVSASTVTIAITCL